MKKILMLLYTAFIANQFITAQVAINTDGTTPNSSAMLDIKSTGKGLLTPRMTTAQRNAIASPATGLMVYDTDVNKFFFYAVGNWIEMGTGSSTNFWTQNGNDIYNNNTGNVGIGVTSPAATLDVMRGTAFGGTAAFRGTNYNSHFNYSTTEDTYIRGGKSGSHIYLNDMNLGNVGIGQVSDFRLTVYNSVVQSNTNTHVLKLKGQNPVLAFADESDNSYGYIKMWSASAFPPYSNGLVIGANPGYPLFFSTNNYGVSMYIGANGNIGMGTTSPATKLHVTKDNEALRITGSSSFLTLYNGSDYKGYLWNKGTDDIELGTAAVNGNGNLYLSVKGTPELTVQSDGRVRVGALGCNLSLTDPTGNSYGLPKFSVFGPLGIKKTGGDQIGEWALVYETNSPNDLGFYFNGGRKAYVNDVTGDWHSFSDFRLKENFENYKPVLQGIKKLDIQTYHYKNDKTNTRSFGLIAQNLQQYFPELVSGNEKDGYLGIAYGKTGVLAIKAIQEQQVLIEMLEKKIETLQKRLTALENRLK